MNAPSLPRNALAVAYPKQGLDLGGEVLVGGVLVGKLRDERFQRILKLAGRLLLLRGLLLVLILHPHRHSHEVVEQHCDADLQHHPHTADDEAADEEGGLPLEIAIGPEHGQRVDPGVARRDPEERDEGAIESAELIWGDVCEDRNPEDGIWQEYGMGDNIRSPPPPKVSKQSLVLSTVASKTLTDAQDDEKDHEGIHHRKQRCGDGGDHLRQFMHSPE